MKDRDISRIDRDSGDTCSNWCVTRAETKRKQDCDRDEPAKFHGVDLLNGRTAGYLRSMYCLRTACT